MRFVCCWGALLALVSSCVVSAQTYPDSLGIRVAFDVPIPGVKPVAAPEKVGTGIRQSDQEAVVGLAVAPGVPAFDIPAVEVPVPQSVVRKSPTSVAMGNGSGRATQGFQNPVPQAPHPQFGAAVRQAAQTSLSSQALASQASKPKPTITRLPLPQSESLVSDSASAPSRFPAKNNSGLPRDPRVERIPFAEPVAESRNSVIDAMVEPNLAPKPDLQGGTGFFSSTAGDGQASSQQAGGQQANNQLVGQPQSIPQPKPYSSGSAANSPIKPVRSRGGAQVRFPSKSIVTTTKQVAIPAAPEQVEKITIPQQGQVDLGNGSVPKAPTQPPTSPMQPPKAAPMSSEHFYGLHGVTGCDSPAAARPSCDAGPTNCDSCDRGGACDGSCNSGLCSHQSGRSGLSRLLPKFNPPCGHVEVGVCSHCGKQNCLGICRIGKLASFLRIGSQPQGQCSGWFAGWYYLNLGRDDDNDGTILATSAGNTALTTGMSRMERSSGLAARIGKMMNQNTAFEFIFWQAFPSDQVSVAASSLTGNPIDANLAFGGLNYDNGAGVQPVDAYFQGAQSIELTRSFDYRNFEFNFLRLPFSLSGCGCNGRTNLALLAGFRYFQAEEGLRLFAPVDDVAYNVETTNDLAGIQVGGLLNYQLTRKLSGQFGTKVGLYNNSVEQRQRVSGGNGTATLGGQPFDVSAEKDDVAFLAELDAGLAYVFSPSWRMNVGYKLLTVSSYADAANQLPQSFTVSDAGQIQDNNSLILHGLFIGAEYSW